MKTNERKLTDAQSTVLAEIRMGVRLGPQARRVAERLAKLGLVTLVDGKWVVCFHC